MFDKVWLSRAVPLIIELPSEQLQSSNPNHTARTATALGEFANSDAGRKAAPTAHPHVGAAQRNVERPATAIVSRGRTWRRQRRSRGGGQARTDQPGSCAGTQASSRTTTFARRSAAGRGSNSLRRAQLPALRRG